MSFNSADRIRRDCEEVVEEGAHSALEDLHGETVLVTGGSGFMGTWLAEMITYLNDRHDFGTRLILVVPRTNGFVSKAPHLVGRKDIALIEQDVRSILELPEYVSWIIHAAGSPDNRVHTSNPLRTVHTIVTGTDALLTAATRLPHLKKVVHVSSGLVYGEQPLDMERIPESYRGVTSDPNAIISVYPQSKRMAETICAAHRSQHRIPIVNVRPFAFIGPYQMLDRPWAINNFLRDALNGGPIRIHGDAETVRSYMYPSDMAWWLLHLMVHGTSGVSYNLGSEEAISLSLLANKIASIFSKPIPIEARAIYDTHLRQSRFVPDTSLARKSFGLSSKVPLETALQRTLDWNRSLLGKELSYQP